MIFFLIIINILSFSGAIVIKSVDELKEFFKTSYIQKETGYYDPGEAKIKYAFNYNPSWSFYRFHHVCIRGGSDGLFLAIDGSVNVRPDSETDISPSEWNDLIGSKYNHPLTVQTFDSKDFLVDFPPIIYHNSTLFTNCNRQHSNSFNPSHLMLKMGFLYELSDCFLKNYGRHKIFKDIIGMPFKQLFLHQCPNPYKSNWSWGKMVSEVVYKKLETSAIIKANYSILLHRGSESTKNEMLCFDDMYFSSRQSHWLQGLENTIEFRKDAAFLFGEPAEARKIYERPVTYNSGIIQSYCPRADSNSSVTKANIKIFQRTQSNTPRTIVNLKEVIETLQKFSINPVEVITITEQTPIEEQIRLFNSFDILVTTHGSHLTNGIFTMHPYEKAIVEIVPFMYDSLYFKNYIQDLGFAEFIISTGHLTPPATQSVRLNDKFVSISNSTPFCAFTETSDFATRGCKTTLNKNPPRSSQTWITCDSNFHSRSCNTFVNTTILYNHMSLLISQSLCKFDRLKGN